MLTFPIRTDLVTGDTSLFEVLSRNINSLKNGDIVAITSKIVSVTQKRIYPKDSFSFDDLIAQERQNRINLNGLSLTSHLAMELPDYGIDTSNSNGGYILLPVQPYKVSHKIREFLALKFKLTQLGILITDSEVGRFRKGSIGVSIGYSGFSGIKDYRGEKDLFANQINITVSNLVDKIANVAVLEMGESNEQQPIVIIRGLKGIDFNPVYPLKSELQILHNE